MSVSIITAAYSATYLNKVWESIKKQTYKDWEWIVVIDGSHNVIKWFSDMAIKDEFKGYNVWRIIIDENQGRFGLVSRNVGAMCASFQKILFLDDDNEWDEDDYIEEMFRVCVETGKVPYTKLHIVGKKPGSTVDRHKETSLSRHHIDLGNMLYRKEYFIKTGYFNDRKNRIMFDWDKIEDIVNLVGEKNFIQVDRNLLFRHKRY